MHPTCIPIPQEVNEDEEAEETDDKLQAQRQTLALALRARQKELSKQLGCSRCASPLVQPTRLLACRHVMCAKCVEETVRYFRECPICSREGEACGLGG